MADQMRVFDRRLVRAHRDRAAAHLGDHDFLFREVAERLADRLDDFNRGFPVALDLGCRGGALARALDGHGGIERLIRCDPSPAFSRRAGGLSLAAEEEALPFAEAVFDLVISDLSLHWVNDLPGALVQIRRSLKPDGLFLAAMFGGETLKELRQVLLEADLAEEGGASPRVSPFADVRDAGDLLQRAGFALPVVDLDTITVTYADAFALMRDLRFMGETNAVVERRGGFTRRTTMMAAARLYQERFQDRQGRAPATFQILYLTAWAPHEAQQKPRKPGSAGARLADALGTIEISAGDKAQPK